MKNLEYCINKFLNSHNNDTIKKIIDNWHCIVGNLHTEIIFKDLKDNILYLTVKDFRLLIEIKLMKNIIIENIKKFISDIVIEDIICKIYKKKNNYEQNNYKSCQNIKISDLEYKKIECIFNQYNDNTVIQSIKKFFIKHNS